MKIYLSKDVVLKDLEQGIDYIIPNLAVKEFTLEVTDLPLSINYKVVKEKLKYSVKARTELDYMSWDITKATFDIGEDVDINKFDEETKSSNIIAMAGLIVVASLLDTINIKDYKKKNKDFKVGEDYGDGFVLDGEKLVLATGKKRPDLACIDMDGETEIKRPYIDEFDGMSDSSQDDDEDAEYEKTFEELLVEAENGDEDAIQEVIEAYQGLSFYEVDEDPAQELYWMEKLAEMGNLESMFQVAKHYVEGYAGKRDLAKAEELLKKILENIDNSGVQKFAYRIAKINFNEQKAKSGDIDAQKILAEEYMSLGMSLEEETDGINFKTAFDYAKNLVKKDQKEGCWILALAYEHGRGTRKNRKKAVETYEKGAELGHAGCQHSLACYYLRGDYLEKNIEKAEELLIKSNQQGYELAPLSLFSLYAYEKESTEENIKRAIEFGEKEAQKGDVTTQYELAKFYTTEGEDEKMIDATRSRYWYAKAALQGHKIALFAIFAEEMWKGQEYKDDEELMAKLKALLEDDEEDVDDSELNAGLLV